MVFDPLRVVCLACLFFYKHITSTRPKKSVLYPIIAVIYLIHSNTTQAYKKPPPGGGGNNYKTKPKLHVNFHSA